ncbi:MAG TPA: hypothetical protein VME45_10395 [Stellaceae bacterium]|nr:hypothetical protein [Stellaceae bacterium]
MTGLPSMTRVVTAALTLLACAGSLAQAEEPVAERLSVPGPITFGPETYKLSWSSHPSANYYKQEYLPDGQASEHFRQMVLVEATLLEADVAHVAASQVQWLDNRKATDPLVNYAILKNPKTGEVILDFVLSADEPKQDYLVEWNAYRYALLPQKDGKRGVLLFGISRRAYGDDTTDFLRALKSTRSQEIDALAKYKLPAVTPRAAD